MSQTSTDVQVFSTSWSAASVELAAIRRDVFIDEQHVPEDLEWDGEDDSAQHWLARVVNANNNGESLAVGTVRLLRNGHVGRMAVRREWRRGGIGAALLSHVIANARSANLRELYLHAQTHAVDFYARHGFIAEGPEFMDAGIPHRTMRLQLRAQRQLGQDHGKFPARNRKATALDIAAQTRRHLRIFSNDLDPTLYASEEFAREISRLARNYRSADVRLLIVDSTGLSPSGHALLALQRRLNSAIQIRMIGHVAETIDENYLIADGCGMFCYSMRDPESAWADYNNVPLAYDYTTRFDELWQHAIEDPNLRLLHL